MSTALAIAVWLAPSLLVLLIAGVRYLIAERFDRTIDRAFGIEPEPEPFDWAAHDWEPDWEIA